MVFYGRIKSFLVVLFLGNTGEVSYVLIVQQPEDKEKAGTEEAIGVYDYENEFDEEDDDEGLDDKSKIKKIKSSQQVKINFLKAYFRRDFDKINCLKMSNFQLLNSNDVRDHSAWASWIFR